MSFEAEYGGVCDECGERIRVGELIRYSGDHSGPIHDDCAADHAPDKPAEVCTECWLEKPCGCDP